MSATEQNLKLQEELNNYNNLLMKLAKEHNKLQLEKEELARTNTVRRILNFPVLIFFRIYRMSL